MSDVLCGARCRPFLYRDLPCALDAGHDGHHVAANGMVFVNWQIIPPGTPTERRRAASSAMRHVLRLPTANIKRLRCGLL